MIIYVGNASAMNGSEGVVESHPTECLPQAEVEQRGIEFAAAQSFNDATAYYLGQCAFVHRDVRSPIHLAHWF